MNRPTTLALLALLMLGCRPSATQQDYGPRIQAANDELLNKGNLGAIPDLFAPTYTGHVTGQDVSGGPKMIEDFVKGLRTAFPDLHVEVQVLATQGDRVAWVRTHRGTHRSDYMGVPASGRAILWRDIIVTRYEAGKIAEEWGVSDLGERLRVP